MASGGQRPVRVGRVTIVDVAAAAGVSRQTVSNAVNNPERVAPETLERVRQEVERLGYTPNAAAQRLRSQTAHAYGFEVSAWGKRRMGHVLDGFLVELTVAAREHRSHLVTFSPQDGDGVRDYEQLLATGLVDGFVITDTMHDDPRPRWLLEHDVPFVSFGRVWDDPSVGRWVDIDGRAGMALAVTHLIEQGYDQIGYLDWVAGSPLGDDRRRGWLTALAEAGRAQDPVLEVCRDELTDATAATERLLDRLGPGAALLCASDMLALGASRAIRSRGLELGRDIGLVGFDDSGVAEAMQMTSLRQPLAQAATHAWDLLARGRPDSDSDLDQSVLIVPELVVRATSTHDP